MKTQQEYLADFNKAITPFFEEKNFSVMLKSLREEILNETNRLTNEAKIIEKKNNEIEKLAGDMVTELRELLASEFPELTMTTCNSKLSFYVNGYGDDKFGITVHISHKYIDDVMNIKEAYIANWSSYGTTYKTKEDILNSDLFKAKITSMYKEIARVNIIRDNKTA